jgi:hypothetical protein
MCLTFIATLHHDTRAGCHSRLVLPPDYLKTWFSFPAETWRPQADTIIAALKQDLTAPV